jgi:hypothetical protein
MKQQPGRISDMSHLSAERHSALLDEQPTEAEQAHLASCSACRAERASYSTLAEMARGAPVIDIPLTSWEQLAPALRREGLVRREVGAFTVGRGWLRVAAALLLLAGGVAAGRISAGASLVPQRAAAGMGSIEAAPTFASLEEAEVARLRAERVSDAALAYLVRHDTSEQTVTVQALRARLSAFEAIRGARNVAPDDPVIGGYYRNAATQYEATLRQMNTALPGVVRMTVY